MEKRIKLIWDFKGPNSELTAKHHAIHLKEFIAKEALEIDISGTEKFDEEHYIAYMVVTQTAMKAVRDSLKPHRGTIYTELE